MDMLRKIIHFSICLIILSLPLYLLRFRIGWLPTNLLELMLGGLFIIWLAQLKNVRPLTSSIFYPIFLIFLGITISTLLSADLQTSAGIWKGWFIAPLLFFLVVASEVKNKKQVRDILLALFLSGAGVSLAAFWYWLSNNLTYDGRLRAFYLSPNYLAMYLSPILILSFYLYFCFKKNIYKILLFIVHCLSFITIYLTYSYGAWLGILAALVFILIIKKNKKIALVFLLVAIVVLFLQMPLPKLQALKSRLTIWQSAGEIIKDHFLIGIGPGMFQEYYLDYQAKFPPYLEWAVPQPHNLFLAFWLQTGLIGLIGFIWLLVIFFKGASPKKLSVILMAAMIYILVHGLVDTTYWKNDLSVIFWLIIALSYTLHLNRV